MDASNAAVGSTNPSSTATPTIKVRARNVNVFYGE